jgi:hypothetical protein
MEICSPGTAPKSRPIRMPGTTTIHGAKLVNSNERPD